MIAEASGQTTARRLLSLALVLAAAGCAAVAPEVPEDIAREFPENMPRPTITNFNEALVCMDNLMVIQRAQPIYVTSQGILNFTNDRSISAGGKEMLITALAQMSARSRSVRFVAYGSDIRDMLDLQGAHPDKALFRVPDYFIRGGVTQHNKNLWNGQVGAGASYEYSDSDDLTGSYSLLGGYGTISLDLSVGAIANLQIVPGAVSANSLALSSTVSKGITADLTLNSLGFSYSFSDNITRDFNTIYRSLIQVGAIELVGKLHGLPYWRCLANAGTIQARTTALREHYRALELKADGALVRFVQQALADSGYYEGALSGTLDDATMTALQDYQRQHNLLATGVISFDDFRTLNLYTPSRDAPYMMWWEDADDAAGTGDAPYGPASTVPIPVSE